MLDFGQTFFWNVINLLILFFVLRKLLFGPITKYMESRADGIKSDLENAENSKKEAAALQKKYEEQLRAAKKEADQLIEEATARANKEYDAIVSAAKKDANAIIAKANEDAALEKQKMVGEIKTYAAGLALAAASKVLEANMDTAANKAIVDKFIDEAGAA